MQLRTSPGECVLTPFLGVGSEVFESVRLGRVGIGIELKPSYYVQAVRNMALVDEVLVMEDDLFSEMTTGSEDE